MLLSSDSEVLEAEEGRDVWTLLNSVGLLMLLSSALLSEKGEGSVGNSENFPLDLDDGLPSELLLRSVWSLDREYRGDFKMLLPVPDKFVDFPSGVKYSPLLGGLSGLMFIEKIYNLF